MKNFRLLLSALFAFNLTASIAASKLDPSSSKACRTPLKGEVALDLGDYRGDFIVYPSDGNTTSGTGQVNLCPQTGECNCAISEDSNLSGHWAIQFSGFYSDGKNPSLVISFVDNKIDSVSGTIDNGIYRWDSSSIALKDNAFREVTFSRSNFKGSWNLEYWSPMVSPSNGSMADISLKLIRGVKYAVTADSLDHSQNCLATFLLSNSGKITDIDKNSFIAAGSKDEGQLIISEPKCH